jgi:hypothetical protein
MGCDEVREINQPNNLKKPSASISSNLNNNDNTNDILREMEDHNINRDLDDLTYNIIKGKLNEDSEFKDCIIKNEGELESNIREFIPTRIINENGKEEVNIKDDIITNSLQIDFHTCYIIALNGMHEVKKVTNEDGNYCIYHDNVPGKKDEYTAIIVKKLSGYPQLKWNSPKP